MENKLRKKNLIITIWTLLGFFIGGSIYVINGGENRGLEFLAEIIGGAIGQVVSSKLIFSKNPKLKALDQRLIKDERNQKIFGEAAGYTVVATLGMIMCVILLGRIKGDAYLSLGAAVFGGVILLVFSLSSYVLAKIR